MQLRHIVAATDESDAGRQGVRAAPRAVGTDRRPRHRHADGAGHGGGVGRDPVGQPAVDEAAEASVERLRRWIEADLAVAGPKAPVSFALTYGLPGIEIGHFAERERADLLVLGRKQRSLMARLVVGDTADAVSRRSMLPCLFVAGRRRAPTGGSRGGRRLRPRDGGPRGRPRRSPGRWARTCMS